jgi:hypothetical protein
MAGARGWGPGCGPRGSIVHRTINSTLAKQYDAILAIDETQTKACAFGGQ